VKSARLRGAGCQVYEQALRPPDVASDHDVHDPPMLHFDFALAGAIKAQDGRATGVCGISGLVNAGEHPADEADELRVRRANAALQHRGPDAEGIWRSGPAILGHRRLSIIDLSPEANQPLLNEDATIGVVVNGEIYDHEAWRTDLQRRGHVFRSKADSEVVLHLYEEQGVACVERLFGMFSFALWDSKARRLVMARDRAGKKPLYYRPTHDGGLVFGSEIQAILAACPRLSPEVNLAAIDDYLTLQYVPSPQTAYSGIYKLDAAHVAVFEPGKGLRLRRYWTKPSGPELAGSEEELAREVRRLLSNAVRRRMVADVPVGAFLSGGIDSSTIVALMAAQSSRPVRTFSIGFPNASDSELPWARRVAEKYGTIHEEATIGPNVTDIVQATVSQYGEPFADSSAIATYCVSKLARQNVIVALSGDGSDESFAGYARYQTAQLGHVHDALPGRFRGPYRWALRALVGLAAPHIAGYVDHFEQGEAVRYPYIMCQFTPEEKLALCEPAAWSSIRPATTERFRKVLAESGRRSQLARLIDLDWSTYLVDDINVKVDIASMAHGLEVRCPFLDTDVVEFAARLPRHMLMRTRGKHILRRAMADVVPREVLRRSKRGFGLPLRRWMSEELGEIARDVLLDKTAQHRGLFRPKEVERLLYDVPRDRNAPDRVWTLLILELWFRRFIDGASSSRESTPCMGAVALP
jgi:asparagine synthase (glutamine-hydrolysing)